MFFFFQAEDGIRDTSVTGVQTCALPICRRSDRHALPSRTRSRPGAQRRRRGGGRRGRRPGDGGDRAEEPRSEERRVGKEWRAREAADQSTKHEQVTVKSVYNDTTEI